MQKHIENSSFTAKSRVKCLSPSLLDAAAPAPGGRVTVPPGPASPEPQSLTCLGDQRKERKPQRRGHGNSRRGRSPRRPRPRAPIRSESRSRLSSTSWRSNWLNAAWPCTDAAAASPPTAVTRPLFSPSATLRLGAQQ